VPGVTARFVQNCSPSPSSVRSHIVSDMMRNPAGKVADHIARVGEDSLCLSIVTAAELRFRAAKSGSSRLLERVEAVLARVPVLPLDVPADAEYGGIRAELGATGQSIGPNDLLIAAHAQALGATIVTADVAEFRRVRGLTVENWIA
jgi:tRNA(fMet)-specific endonuclease VapC